MIRATMTPTAAGEARKLDAHALLEARRELYVLRGRRALLAALLAGGEATADDVRNAVEPPDEITAMCLGVVPGLLARTGLIERVGFTESRRPDAHAWPVSIWRLADRAAALGWLAAPRPAGPDTHRSGCCADLFD